MLLYLRFYFLQNDSTLRILKTIMERAGLPKITGKHPQPPE